MHPADPFGMPLLSRPCKNGHFPKTFTNMLMVAQKTAYGRNQKKLKDLRAQATDLRNASRASSSRFSWRFVVFFPFFFFLFFRGRPDIGIPAPYQHMAASVRGTSLRRSGLL
jgi:hypothetical protein